MHGTALIAFLSSLTSARYTATQYALFSSLYALPGKVLEGFSGFVVDAVGFPWFFLYTAALSLPGLLLLWWLARRAPFAGSAARRHGTARRRREWRAVEIDLERVLCRLDELARDRLPRIPGRQRAVAAALLRRQGGRARARLRQSLRAPAIAAEPAARSLPDARWQHDPVHGARRDLREIHGLLRGRVRARGVRSRRCRCRWWPAT